MTGGQIEANKVVFKKVFSEEFWFVIPEYQRSYVWQEENVSELVEDLLYAFAEKPHSDYFLGSLVLKRTTDSSYPEYEVLDGQQRLTTFFMMMAVLRDIVSHPNTRDTIQRKIYQEENRLENIPARMRITYKIRDKVEDFIKEFIVQQDGTTKEEQLKSYLDRDNVSLSNMAKAINLLRATFLHQQSELDLEEFIRFIFNKAMFIYVSTDNMEDAFRLFTILNDRGIPLTNADILKSQNIGALESEKDAQKYAKIWEEIEGKHGENFDRFLQFIRTILVKEKARMSLLDEFNEKIYKGKPKPKLQPGKETFQLIEKYNEIYEDFIELQERTLSNSYKNLVTIMKIGFRSDDWIPPLMHYCYKFGTNCLDKFLQKLEFKFAGDWVCGVTPTMRIEAMNNILKAIDQTSPEDLVSLIDNPNLFAINEQEYRQNIEGNIYKKQYCRYLLLKLEYLLSDNTVHLSNYNYITVEHILPQNPAKNSQWRKDFTDEEREYWVDKLANLVLINKRKNSALSNLNFAEKKKRYLKGRIDVFQGSKVFIDSKQTITPDILKTRQQELITLLTGN